MLVLVLIGTVLMLWLWFRRDRNMDEPPLASGFTILIGHALQFAGNSAKLWNTFIKLSHEALERGGAIKTTIGPRTLYFVSDPVDFLKVSNACINKDAVYEFARPWTGDGLVTSKPSIWKVHRKLLNPAFNQNVLDNFMGVFNSQSRCLVQNLTEVVGKGPFDPFDYTKRNSLETICLTALGMDIKEKTEANMEFVLAIDKMFNSLVTRFQQFWLHNNLIFNLSSLKRKQDEYIKILQGMSNTILKLRKENISNISDIKKTDKQTRGSRYKPFMELLLEISREKEIITDLVIREQADTLVVAGSDTSATLIMYCMVLVGSYPRVEEKIYEELKNVLGDENRDVTKQDLSKLVYLGFYKRNSPSLSNRTCRWTTSGRRCKIKSATVHAGGAERSIVAEGDLHTCKISRVNSGYNLKPDKNSRNCTLYKGKSAFLSIYGVNRHPMWGLDVEECRPERWLEASTLLDFPNVSFGMGRRNCIGKIFAMTLTKVTLVHIIRSYKFQSDYTKLKLMLDVLLKPYSGHEISIDKRC